MTGCRSIDSAIDALEKLFSELRIIKGVIDGQSKKVIEKPYVSDPGKLYIENIKKFNIAMINSNFDIGFCIDRAKLYSLLLCDKVECAYDPIIHASVNVKYNHPDKTISIFIFESGSIIITGARNCNQLNDAYEYINKYLLQNYKGIIKNEVLTNSTILKYLIST